MNMKRTIYILGWLLLLTGASLVTGLCSTCLDERCHGNGECIIGCKVGYVGHYCEDRCPFRCANNECYIDRIKGTITCIDGCEGGYCGAKCTYECPGDCVTCDQQCGSCNVTLCPERHYGTNCTEVCSTKYDKCERLTGQCLRCRRGYFGDQCSRPCRACFTKEDHISDDCLSGCEKCQSDDTCPAGFHGISCELKCSSGCWEQDGCNRATGECSTRCVSGYHGLTCNYTCSKHCLSGRCDRATGECSTGCVSGYQGLTCNYTCSKHCVSGRCDRATGECSTGCVSGYHGLTCNYTCNKFCVGGVCYQTNGVCTSGCITGYRPNMDMCEQYNNGGTQRAVIIAVSITFVCLVAGMVIAAVVIWRRRRSGRTREHVENGEVDEPLIKYEKGDVTFKSIQMADDDSRPGTVDSGTLNLKLAEAGELFVPTKAFDDVRQTLEENCHVTICGASGEGKTTMALMLGQEYLTQGYELVFVDRPDVFDLGACISSGRKVCLIFDDIFGSDGRSTDVSNVERLCDTLKLHIDRQNRKGDIDLKGLEQVRQNDDILIQRSAKKPGRNMLVTDQVRNVRNDIDLAHINSQSKNVRAIFTSKTYNFNEGIAKSKHISMFYNKTIVDLTVNPGSTYSCQEKRAMLVKYKEKFPGRHFELLEEEEVITQDLSLFGFPQTCRLFFESFSKEPANATDFFRNPIEYLSLEFTNILGRKNEQAAALILVMMCEGELTLPDLESPNRNEKLDRMMEDIANFTNPVTWSGIAGAARRFRGTFLSRGGKLSFAHSSIYDAFANTLYQSNPTFVLNYCSLDFLFKRLRASPTDEKGVSHYLVVEEEYFPLLIRRFVSSMEKGGFSKTVAHPIMQNKVFVQMFLKEVDQQASWPSTWFQHKEKEKGLLYWIVRSEGTYLVENIERVLKMRFTDDEIKEALFSCVECDCLTLFKLLMGKLEHKLDKSMLGKYLLASVKSSGEEMVKYLLKSEAKVSEIGRKRQNFLHLLCTFNSPGVLGMVKIHAMKEDLDSAIHAVDEQGNTPLMMAALHGTFDCFKLIRSEVKTSVKDIDSLIHLACIGGNKHIVESVLTPQNINTKENHGRTPLMMAALGRKSDIVDLLLSQGADVTLVDEQGNTLIHLACAGGNKHIVESVLTPRNINTRGFNGVTPIMMAALAGKSDIVDLLLSQGADVTLVDEQGNALIHLGGNKHIVESVLTPQNINTRGFTGRTPIMMTSLEGKSDIFDLLLSQGADVTLVDEDRNTLIHLACIGGNKHIVESVLTPQNINTRGFTGRTPIMTAAFRGKSDIFDLLLSQGADVTLVDEQGNTLIHRACDVGSKHIVESVLTTQNINTRGFHGRTPIMMAALGGKSDIFDLLLSQGADVTLVDEQGNTLIHLACVGGSKHIVESGLTPHNINARGFTGRTPIMMAAYGGKSDIVDLLLSQEADVTLVDEERNTLIHLACIGRNKHIAERVLTPQNINTTGFTGRTPIMMAALGGKSDIFDLLLSQGADVTLVDEQGNTLIHLACIGGSKHIVESGLTPHNINARGFTGRTPIMMAAYGGKSDIFDVLLSQGADITLVDEYGDTLIHHACIGGNKHIVERVLTPQNINARGNIGGTPIMMSAGGGKSDIFDLLLSQGADVTLVGEYGNALIHYACIGGNKHIIESVLTPQNINTRGNHGRTPIMMAANGGKSDIFDILLSQGADVTLVDEVGDTLIHHACNGGNKHIVISVLTPQNINTRGFNGRTPIMMAASEGKSDIFDLLLSQGADVTLVDENGNTLIHRACIGGNKHIVENVLTPQNINTRGFNGRTPIMMAAYGGKSDIFDILLSQGADVTLVDEVGDTLIHHACNGGNKHIVISVLTPQNINTRGFNGRTPIMMAASEGKSDIFDLLLSQGADVTLVDENGNTLIHRACIGGNKHIVENVLTPQNINTRGFHGRTPIMEAAYGGKSDIFDLLLSQGADVTLVDEDGNTLIHRACIGGNKHIVERVLTPQNINTRGFTGRTPIMMAASEGKSDIFDLLLSQGADVTLVDEDGNTLIHRACIGGNKHIVENVLTPQNINTRGFHGRTPIMEAAYGGKSDIFDLLLSQGADVTLVDEDGNTLIHRACIGGNKHIVERVLTPQNINTRGFTGRTPIMMAASEGKSDIFDLLLSQGADVTLVDEDGNTLIHRACIGGNKHIVENVLTPQNINTRGFNGRTPIMIAAGGGKSDIFDLLLSQEADVTLVDEVGDTLIHLASDGGNKHIVERVLTPQNINTRGNHGRTPIMLAAYEGKSDIFDLLLSQGADVTLVDEYGYTLIHLVCFCGNKHIVESVLTPQNINTRSKHGSSPIMIAAFGAKSDIFNLLFSREVNLTFEDGDGDTLLHHACIGGNKQIVESVLTPHNINTRNKKEMTPIMAAAHEGHINTIAYLCETGADLTCVDTDGRDVVAVAEEAEKKVVVKYLEKRIDK